MYYPYKAPLVIITAFKKSGSTSPFNTRHINIPICTHVYKRTREVTNVKSQDKHKYINVFNKGAKFKTGFRLLDIS